MKCLSSLFHRDNAKSVKSQRQHLLQSNVQCTILQCQKRKMLYHFKNQKSIPPMECESTFHQNYTTSVVSDAIIKQYNNQKRTELQNIINYKTILPMEWLMALLTFYRDYTNCGKVNISTNYKTFPNEPANYHRLSELDICT